MDVKRRKKKKDGKKIIDETRDFILFESLK